MAPPARRRKQAVAVAPPAPVLDPADRISRLPEEVQAQILSLLPAQEAVRTCVLARTWRHGWKFTRRLLITGKCVEGVREFVDHLLHVRRDRLELASLDAAEIRFNPFEKAEDLMVAYPIREDICSINGWIDQVLKCEIQTLRVDISTGGHLCFCLPMDTMPLLDSLHLTRLELTGVLFTCGCLNLDGCPSLEHLRIHECCLEVLTKITSLSIKRLVITSCWSNDGRNRIQICVPRLVSFCLDNSDVRTPMLDRMPKLVGAKLRIDSYMDQCNCVDPMACYHVTRDRDTSDTDTDSDSNEHEEVSKCVVLEGLAHARDIVLIVDIRTYIFRRDLRWCPTFFNLKTLVLIEEYWCEPAYCSVVECMLEHAPLLEKLTLIFKKVPQKDIYKIEIEGYPDAKVTSTKIPQYLQTVNIICESVNGIHVNVLNLLNTLNICFKTRVTKYMPSKAKPPSS